MKKRIFSAKLIVLILLVLLIFSCDYREAPSTHGSLELVLDQSNSSTNRSYLLKGYGPVDASFLMETENRDVEISQLEPGRWILNLEVRDLDGNTIGMGSADIDVEVGVTKSRVLDFSTVY